MNDCESFLNNEVTAIIKSNYPNFNVKISKYSYGDDEAADLNFTVYLVPKDLKSYQYKLIEISAANLDNDFPALVKRFNIKHMDRYYAANKEKFEKHILNLLIDNKTKKVAERVLEAAASYKE